MKQRPHLVRFVSLAVISIIFVLLFQSCELGGNITVENLRNGEVDIYFSTVREDGSTDEPTRQRAVPPNATEILGITFIDENWVNRIEGIDTFGKVVFSHDYKMGDLKKIGWKITIPP